MPVTFDVDPSKRPSQPLSSTLKSGKEDSEYAFIRTACPNQTGKCEAILQSSFGDAIRGKEGPVGDSGKMKVIKRGGLVDVAVEAYSQHHHLVIRPDDVWIAILTQLSFYISAHAEELRSTFVSHEDKKELVVVANEIPVNYADMANSMAGLLRKNVKDPEICDWVIADFSTTNDVDRTIYAIQLMATLKEYFSYAFHLRCGLPCVTLKGIKGDWENLLVRLKMLESFGAEPAHWSKMLKAVLSRFVKCFEIFGECSNPSKSENGASHIQLEREKTELRDFWNKIACHIGGGSGPTYLSGWITVFCPWSTKGVWMDNTCAPGSSTSIVPHLTSNPTPSPLPLTPPRTKAHPGRKSEVLNVDGLVFPAIDTNKIPSGFVEVDVKLNHAGKVFQTVMIAGHLGGRVLQGPRKADESLGVAAGWFIFIKGDGQEGEDSGEAGFRRLRGVDRYDSLRQAGGT